MQQQAAVLDGVGDGVAATPDGIVRVCNAAAARMLGVDDPVGARISTLGLSPELVAALDASSPPPEPSAVFPSGERILYVDRRPVRRHGRYLGIVAVLRDRTDLMALSQRLDAVGSMTNALRAQRHEFANRVHVAAGLIDAGRVEQARSFLDELRGRGPISAPGGHLERIAEPLLQAIVGAKAIEAAERGVQVAVAEGTFVRGRLAAPEDVRAVLGNLIDNAVRAALGGERESSRSRSSSSMTTTSWRSPSPIPVLESSTPIGCSPAATPASARVRWRIRPTRCTATASASP